MIGWINELVAMVGLVSGVASRGMGLVTLGFAAILLLARG
jgi:hypothetical protein